MLKPLIDQNKLVMVGVIQEQHADRCRLFQQWKQLDFPVVQDLVNSNSLAVVPVYVAIDEWGIVQKSPRRPDEFIRAFVDQAYETPTELPPTVDLETAQPDYWRDQVAQRRSIDHLVAWADSLVQWRPSTESVRQAIELYQEALSRNQEPSWNRRAAINFRIGTANRLVYELEGQADAELFRQSVEHWETALQQDPNQYIYRRRIEQYGPRLKKPYSFYDWVSQARTDLKKRNATPHPLRVEPNGAELADRATAMQVQPDQANPDPENQIIRETNERVQVHVNVVPTNPKPGDVVAVHFGFHVSGGAKWNHEAAPMQVWVQSTGESKLTLSEQRIEDLSPHATAESRQPISISMEVRIPPDATGPCELTGFALFNLCHSDTGQCVFRRKDFSVAIPVQLAGDQ